MLNNNEPFANLFVFLEKKELLFSSTHMKRSVIFIFLTLSQLLNSQYKLTQEDKELTEYIALMRDSIYKINNFEFDSKDLSAKNGLWVIYYDKDYKECQKLKHVYKRIVLLKNGYSTHLQYLINDKNQLISVTENYPEIQSDSIFNGYKLINYSNKRKVTTVSFHKFINDSVYKKGTYSNYNNYFSNGQLKSYSLKDDITKTYETQEYDRNGFNTYTLKLNANESLKVQRKKRGQLILMEQKIAGAYYRIKIVNGKEIYRKKL